MIGNFDFFALKQQYDEDVFSTPEPLFAPVPISNAPTSLELEDVPLPLGLGTVFSLNEAITLRSKQEAARTFASGIELPQKEEERNALLNDFILAFSPLDIQEILQSAALHQKDLVFVIKFLLHKQHDVATSQLVARILETCPAWFTPQIRVELFVEAVRSNCGETETICLSEGCLEDLINALLDAKMLFAPQEFLQNTSFMQRFYDSDSEEFFSAIVSAWPNYRKETSEFILFCIDAQEEEAALQLLAETPQLSDDQYTSFFLAAMRNALPSLASTLFKKNIDINCVDTEHDGMTALIYAGKNRWNNYLVPFIQRGALLGVTDAWGSLTAYDWIIEWQRKDKPVDEEALLSAWNPEHVLTWQHLIFLISTERYSYATKMIDTIIEKLHQPNSVGWWNDAKKINEVFFTAAEQHEKELVQKLLPYVDGSLGVGDSTETLLMRVAELKNSELCMQLLAHGASLVVVDQYGSTAFQYIMRHNPQFFSVQYVEGWPLENAETDFLLHELLKYNKKEEFLVLLARLESLSNAQVPQWYEAQAVKNKLFASCCRENVQVPVSLFQKIDPNFVVTSDGNKTPLMYAVKYETGKDIVADLISKNADITAVDSSKKTALKYIVEAYGKTFAQKVSKKKVAVCEKKVENKKANTTAIKEAQKLFELIKQNNTKELETRLKNNDVQIDFTLKDSDPQGSTVLMQAAKKKMASVVPLLVERGANLFDKDAQGKSAIDYIEEFLGRKTIEDIATHWLCSREETKDFIIFLLENEYDEEAQSMTTSKRLWLANPGTRKRVRNDTATWTKTTFSKIFMRAADRDIRKLAERMVTHIDIAYADEDGVTPLLAAARQAWGMLFRRLSVDGADFSARDNEGKGVASYMVEALENASTAFSDCIISYWPLEKKESVEFITLLFQAKHEKSKRRVKRLTQEEKAEKLIQRLMSEKISTAEWPQTGKTALFELALQKKKPAMALALVAGVDVDVTPGKKSFIEIAISEKMKDVAEALIENGACLTAQDTKKKIILLQLEEAFGKNEVLKMVQKVPVDGRHTEKLFAYCVSKGLKDELAVLVQNLKKAKKQPSWSPAAVTELYFDSLEKGEDAFAQLLVELVDVSRLRKGHNAFNVACRARKEAVVIRLLQTKCSMFDTYEGKKVYEILEESFGLAKTEQFLEQSVRYQIIQRQFFDFVVAQNRSYAVLLKKLLTKMPLSEKPEWWIADYRSLFTTALRNKDEQHAIEYIAQFPVDKIGAQGKKPLEEAIEVAFKQTALQLLLQGAPLVSSKKKCDLYVQAEAKFGKSFFTDLRKALVEQQEYNKVQMLLLHFIAEKKEQFVISVLQDLLAHPHSSLRETDKIELFSAAVQLGLEKITLFLVPHIDPNSLTIDKQHLIVQAARSKSIETVKALIYRGARLSSSMVGYDIPVLLSTVLSEEELETLFSTLDCKRPEIEGVVLDLLDIPNVYSMVQGTLSKRYVLLHILFEKIKKLPAQQKPGWWVKDARIFYDTLILWSKNFYSFRDEVTLLRKTLLNEIDCKAEAVSYKDIGCIRLPQLLKDVTTCHPIGSVLDGSFSQEELTYFLKAGVRICVEHKEVEGGAFHYEAIEHKRNTLRFSGVSRQSTLAEFMCKYSDSELAPKLCDLSLESPELAVVLQTLIENNFTESFLELFSKIQEVKNHPLLGLFGDKAQFVSNQNKLLGILFKALSTKNERLIRLLLPYVNVKAHSMDNNGRTVLMEAVRAKVDPAFIYEIIAKGASLLQCDNQCRFAFDYLVRETEIRPSVLSNILTTLNVLPIMHDATVTNKDIVTYLQQGHQYSDMVPLIDKIAAALFVGEKNLVASYFLSLATVSGKVELIASLCAKFGEELREPLVNAAFTVDMSHCQIASNDSDIPPKDQQVIITELSELYKKYVSTSNSGDLKSLGDFEEKVLTKKAYLATPSPNTQALTDFYTTIDNASCGVIATLKQKVSAIEIKYQKQILDLEKENVQEAKELLDLIRTTLHEFIEAAHACGTRIYSNAIDQYYLVVKEKKRDLKEHIYSELVTRRQSMAMTICNGQGNDVHTYGYFMKLFGERFGLRGYQAFLNYEDRTFSFENHSQQLFDAADNFEASYAKPFDLVQFVRGDLKSGEKKNLFIDYLLTNHPKSWDIKASNELVGQVRAMWQSISSVQERNEKIAAFLASKAYITVDDTDLVSLEALQREIESQVKAGRLYVARSQETENNETNFTFDTIIEALVTLGILR